MTNVNVIVQAKTMLYYITDTYSMSKKVASCFVTNAELIERAVSCWHLHKLISQATQYLDSWLSDLLQSELKMKLLEVEGARAPVPHSWRRHWHPPIRFAIFHSWWTCVIENFPFMLINNITTSIRLADFRPFIYITSPFTSTTP